MESLLLTVADTAALLRVSVDTIRRGIAAGLIPSKKLRSTIRISRAWVEAFAVESAPALLSVRQVSRKLGISVPRVRSLLKRGMLAKVLIGKTHRIPVASVAALVKDHTVTIRPAAKVVTAPIRRLPVVTAMPVAAPSRGTGFRSVRGV